MQGAEPVNDEFEVGFDQRFEQRWHYAELAGRVVMVAFLLCGLAGLFGRGPFSHRRAYSSAGGLSVDYEPVARHGTPTVVTVHVPNETPQPRLLRLSTGQAMLEPMGLKSTTPPPQSSEVERDGITWQFTIQPSQPDALIRLVLEPTAIGPVSLWADDGQRRVAWAMTVVP